MIKIINRLFLIVAAFFFGAAIVSAANFTNLHSFSALTTYPGTNSDGSGPEAGLVSDGSTLYGTAADGGPAEAGTVFALTTNGGFTTLYGFNYLTSTNGSGPVAGLALSGSTLYGTTRAGGTNGLGTIFSIGTNGMQFLKLHDFGAQLGRYPPTQLNTNTGGAYPETALGRVNTKAQGFDNEGEDNKADEENV